MKQMLNSYADAAHTLSADSAQLAVRCREVSMSFKKKNVLHGVSFEIKRGSIVGLLGPNGAGKSTLMRILTGLMEPSAGSVEVLGSKPSVDTLRDLSFLPDRGQLPNWLTAEQWLGYASGIYPDWDRSLENQWVRKLEVDVSLRIATLSRGQEARLQLLTCLSRRAPLVILDEPFTGVDLLSRENISSAIADEAAAGDRTFLIATHDIREMESLFDRILLIGDGTIKGVYDTEALRAQGQSVESCYREVFA
ncbi:ABC transporter ATP-binding protein [Paenibacillus kobensis]|uniref:ABC transporter ATP-binding protein n=1 Tax=Paenibacillus kobensis TaxID=59841 RepID=UPI000FDA4610|nr:ABC transporter ATP-binding protein [Paenibacillus kobensis]